MEHTFPRIALKVFVGLKHFVPPFTSQLSNQNSRLAASECRQNIPVARLKGNITEDKMAGFFKTNFPN